MSDKQILENLINKYGKKFILNELNLSTIKSAEKKAYKSGRHDQWAYFRRGAAKKEYSNFSIDPLFDFYDNTGKLSSIIYDGKIIGLIVETKANNKDYVYNAYLEDYHWEYQNAIGNGYFDEFNSGLFLGLNTPHRLNFNQLLSMCWKQFNEDDSNQLTEIINDLYVDGATEIQGQYFNWETFCYKFRKNR